MRNYICCSEMKTSFIIILFVLFSRTMVAFAAESCQIPESTPWCSEQPQKSRDCKIREILWPSNAWQRFEIEERFWSWSERRDDGSLTDSKKNKLATLTGLAIVDYLQTVEFLFHSPGVYGGRKIDLTKVKPNEIDLDIYGSLMTREDRLTYLTTTQPWIVEDYYIPYTEGNPLLGSRPSRRDILTFGVTGIAVTALLAYILPESVAKFFLDSVLMSEALNVEDNQNFLNLGKGPLPIPVMLTWKF